MVTVQAYRMARRNYSHTKRGYREAKPSQSYIETVYLYTQQLNPVAYIQARLTT